MGFNTQVLIFNDGLGQIARYPEEFASALGQLVHRTDRHDRELFTLSVQGHEVGQVITTAHADIPRVLVSHGNWLWEVLADGETFERTKTEPHMHTELLWRAKLARDAAQAVIDKLENGYA